MNNSEFITALQRYVIKYRKSIHRLDGGPGSGNWGHEGVKGQLGGSASGGGSQNRSGNEENGFFRSGHPEEAMTAFTPKNDTYEKADYFDEWQRVNMKGRDNPNRIALTEIYKEEGMDGIRKEYYSSKTSEVTKDLHEVNWQDAGESIAKTMSQSTFHGWFVEANSDYKPRVVEAVIANPESRNAALSLMYTNFQDQTGSNQSFEEFLTTPQIMYRGGHGQEHIEEDVFSSYSFNKDIAQKFAGPEGTVYEAEIKPIDTWGCVNTALESEILVPSWIAPNGNKDEEDYQQKGYIDRIRQILFNKDGGPGSGNFGHEGVPGQVGGSAPTSGSLNERIRNAYSTGDYTDVSKEVRNCIQQIPAGSTITSKGLEYKKTGENEYEYEFLPGKVQTVNDNYIVNSIDPFDINNAPTIKVAETEIIAETKIESGELSPKETSVPSKYTGEPIDNISQETMDSKLAELRGNQGDSEKPITSSDLEYMAKNVILYGNGDECFKMLSTQAPEYYEEFSRIFAMNQEEKEEYAKKAESIDEFLRLSDKYDQPVYRALGFIYDSPESTKKINNFISGLKEGEEIEMKHISSWAKSLGTAEAYASSPIDYSIEENMESCSVVYHLREPKTVADIGDIKQSEGEALSPSSMKLRVTSVQYRYNEEYMNHRFDVEVEEL